MSDAVSRDAVMHLLQEWTYCCDVEVEVRALPAVQPDAAAIREAALREAAAMLTSGAMHGCDNPGEVLECADAILALIKIPTGKEVMPSAPVDGQADTAPAGLSAGGGAEGPFRFDPEDWAEDFAHENGNYLCLCMGCDRQFFGHKRRVVCKTCALSAHVNETPKSEHDAANVLTPATKGGDA